MGRLDVCLIMMYFLPLLLNLSCSNRTHMQNICLSSEFRDCNYNMILLASKVVNVLFEAKTV